MSNEAAKAMFCEYIDSLKELDQLSGLRRVIKEFAPERILKMFGDGFGCTIGPETEIEIKKFAAYIIHSYLKNKRPV